MGVPVIIHQRPDLTLKSALAKFRRASEKRSGRDRRVAFVRARVAFASMAITTPQRPWLTETEVKARHARNLIEDNPTSG